MERDRYLAHLAADGTRMAGLARGDLDAPVPSCPDWTLRDLVEHTGFVHRWQTAVVRDAPATFPDPATWRHGPAAGESWADWLQRGVDDAVNVMRGVDPDEPRWTWFEPDQTAGWYVRRIAQETVVHRVDAELAAGTRTPIDPALAVDGIDEMVDVFMQARDDPMPPGWSGETIHLHATDIDGEWLLTVGAEGIDVARGHAKGDVALRGAAADLLLWLWNRADPSTIESFGDADVAARAQALFRI